MLATTFLAVVGAGASEPAPKPLATCEDGTPRFDGSIVDGRRHGRWRTMQVAIDATATRCVCPESEGRYEHGVEVGAWTFYSRYVDADVARRRVDLCTRYGVCDGDKGCTPSVVTFKIDERTGVQESFYASGALRSRGRFVDGRREGEHTTWFESGRLHRRGQCRHGVAVGSWEVGTDDDRPLARVALAPANVRSTVPREDSPGTSLHDRALVTLER